MLLNFESHKIKFDQVNTKVGNTDFYHLSLLKTRLLFQPNDSPSQCATLVIFGELEAAPWSFNYTDLVTRSHGHFLGAKKLAYS